MIKHKWATKIHNRYGYYYLDPLPEQSKISQFYETEYYELIRKGGRAPEIRRMLAGGEEAASERTWLEHTLYEDVCAILCELKSGKRLLDIGCGTGNFIEYTQKKGYQCCGTEVSCDAAAIAKKKGLTVYNCKVEQLGQELVGSGCERFDVITMLNVLEHVTDPAEIMRNMLKYLEDNGVICIRVPNDFTAIQEAAKRKITKEAWWIAAPDHINYFNFESLRCFLRELGLEIVYAQGDFPMEMFLLMGDDYVGNTDVGSACHRKRISFEMALDGEFRRKIYNALGSVGVGRDCLVFCKVSRARK